MTPEQLKDRVIEVLALTRDPEAAHSAEDKLHRDVIKAFCPEWVVAEIDRLSAADFKRWCA